MKHFAACCLLLSVAILSGCARHTFQGQALAPAALAAHRTVAVLPFAVELERLRDVVKHPEVWAANPETSATNPLQGALVAERQQLGYQLQAALQAELMRQQAEHPGTSTFQNPADTNQRLARAGITYESLPRRSMAELRAALGVDAVLTGQTYMRQLLPGSVSIALFVLSDNTNPMADNAVRTYLDIYDTQDGRLVWQFDHELRGKPSTSPVALAKALVHDMQGAFPYIKK